MISFEKCKMESDSYFTSSKCEVSGKMESAYGRDLRNYANKQQMLNPQFSLATPLYVAFPNTALKNSNQESLALNFYHRVK